MKNTLSGFKQFILRGNVVDLAVGVVIGASFSGLITALVKDILTPFISALFKAPDFSGLHFTINDSTFLYGDFLNALISFLIVSLTIYFCVALPINKLIARAKRNTVVLPTSTTCPECLSEIPKGALRCKYCGEKVSPL